MAGAVMRAIIHVNHAEHQKQHAEWMGLGIAMHDFDVGFAPYDQPAGGDVVVIWGWRQTRVIEDARRRGVPILVMERGHIQPRMIWTSCGWNGLQNHAVYPEMTDGAERFIRNFGHLLKPYAPGKAYVLVCGQVRGDASIGHLDIEKWGQDVTDRLVRRGHEVVYRPHPLMRRQGDNWCPVGATLSLGELDADLACARACVVYSSTACVEAALGGIPVVALNIGAMAWPIASKTIEAPFHTPTEQDRLRWAGRLAWTQWTRFEIASGAAWEALVQCMPTGSCSPTTP